MLRKRGDAAAGAAIFLVIMMALIITFLLVLNPSERAEILGENITTSSSSSTATVIKETVLNKNPGRLSYIKDKEIEKVIPSTNIYTVTKSSVLASESQMIIKKALFSSQEKNLYFKLSDLKNTKKVLLDFGIDSFKGEIIVDLNGKNIFKRKTNKIQPLILSSGLLKETNTLTFRVSSPGIAFWATNQYVLKNIKVVADVKDISQQESKHLFYVDKDEAQNIKEVSLRYTVGCLPKNKGKLSVKLNGYSVFSGTPENCDDLVKIKIAENSIKSGSNWLSFSTENGDYKFSHVAIKIQLKGITYPTYYFDVDQKYFHKNESLKDAYDVVMTLSFSDDKNKEASLYINGHKTSFDTNDLEFSRKINAYIEPWSNSIKIIPDTALDIRSLKVEVKE